MNQVDNMAASLPDTVKQIVYASAPSTSRGQITVKAKLTALVNVLGVVHAKMLEEACEELSTNAASSGIQLPQYVSKLVTSARLSCSISL